MIVLPLLLSLAVGCRQEELDSLADSSTRVSYSSTHLCEEDLGGSGFGLCGFLEIDMLEGDGSFNGLLYENGEEYNPPDPLPFKLESLQVYLLEQNEMTPTYHISFEAKSTDFPVTVTVTGQVDREQYYYSMFVEGKLGVLAYGQYWSSSLTQVNDGGSLPEATLQFEPVAQVE